jgi:hypothetical protein
MVFNLLSEMALPFCTAIAENKQLLVHQYE